MSRVDWQNEYEVVRSALFNLVHNVEWLVDRDPSPSPKAALDRAKVVLQRTILKGGV